MKRWVFILSLLLIMVAVPAVAKNGLNVDVYPDDRELDFYGFAGEEEVFIDYLQLTATGRDVDHFRFTVHELKRVDGGGGEIPRTRVKFAGDKTLRDGVPKVFPVIIRGVVEEPGTYEGKAEIVPLGQSQFEPKQIDLRLEAKARPSPGTEAEVSPSEALARAWYIPSVLFATFLFGILVILAGALRKSMPEGQRSWLDYGNFYIVTWGIVAVIIGFLGILLFVDRFGDIA